ncbi:hypothetical protein J4N46_04350 [Capnocytophaga sp. Marseille-Q4570]|uniref:Uncharacterized protein n=1 Tax=Capnocytophaga bilenii TaxID=2819369 RepID=A0ABS3PXM3_9FLAO|nr:hypothetical protein [Capnocytophaga bilenii]MBO1883669.1 hypothetical protein [Capnocytophaga bilenii]
MMNNIVGIIKQSLDNISYLYYLLLIFCYAFLIADILSLWYLDNPITKTIGTSINIINILIFIICFMFCYFIGMFIILIRNLIFPPKSDYYEKGKMSLYEMRERSVIEDNKVMYEEYKFLIKERNIQENGECFIYMIIIMGVIDFFSNNGSLRILWYNNILLFIVLIGTLISLLYFSAGRNSRDYTGISRKKNANTK